MPVLSKTTFSALAMFSIAKLPLINTPNLLALPIPAKKANGTEITSEHGHEIISMFKA